MPNTLVSEDPGASCSALHFGDGNADGPGVPPYHGTAGIYGINVSLHEAWGAIVKPASVGVSRRKLTFLQVLLDGHIFSDSLQHLPFQVPCSCPPAGASLWSPLSMLVQGSSLGNVSSHKIATGRWGEGEDCCFSAHLGPQAPHCAAAATLGSLGWKGQRRASERAPKDREQMLKPQLLSQLRQGFLCLKRGLW